MLQNYNFSTNPQGDGENSITTNCHYLFVLHELPLMYHELSLIVCFTRIAINVSRIVINCFWRILHQGAGEYSSHGMPAWACAVAGIYGCGLSLSSILL
jgi:hypothetical protein